MSKALSLLSHPGELGIRTRRIAVVVADGVEAEVAYAAYAALADAGAVPRFVGRRLGTIDPTSGRPIGVEVTLETAPAVLFDAIVLPDGDTAVAALAQDAHAIDFVKDQFRHCKPILAFGASARLLDAAGIARAKDPGVIVAPVAEASTAIASFVKVLARHRVYDRQIEPAVV